MDECDYIGSSQITNILNIRNEAPERIKVMAASTPSGKHEEFYKWCVDSSKSYKPFEEDTKNFKFTGYNVTTSLEERNERGNGWTEIYAPSVVNKELLKINPITEQTYLQDLRDEFSDLRYAQEVMAEFGEQELGVYRKEFLQAALKEGIRTNHSYFKGANILQIREYRKHHMRNLFFLGVDWDRNEAAGTTIVGTMLDMDFINDEGVNEPKFKVIFREEIPKSQFTFTIATDRIIQLNDIYNFDWIAIDRGYGDTQIEMLHKYGIQNPETGLNEKVVGYQFGEKLEVRDPYTFKKVKQPMKPFMVNNSVVLFERGKVVFDHTDKKLLAQFEAYCIKRVSDSGIPIYTDKDEHIVDATNLTFLIFQQKYGALFKTITSTKLNVLRMPDRTKNEPIESRDLIPNVGHNTERNIASVLHNDNSQQRAFVSRSYTTGSKMFGSSTGRGKGFGFRRRSF